MSSRIHQPEPSGPVQHPITYHRDVKGSQASYQHALKHALKHPINTALSQSHPTKTLPQIYNTPPESQGAVYLTPADPYRSTACCLHSALQSKLACCPATTLSLSQGTLLFFPSTTPLLLSQVRSNQNKHGCPSAKKSLYNVIKLS